MSHCDQFTLALLGLIHKEYNNFLRLKTPHPHNFVGLHCCGMLTRLLPKIYLVLWPPHLVISTFGFTWLGENQYNSKGSLMGNMQSLVKKKYIITTSHGSSSDFLYICQASTSKLDGADLVDNRPSANKFHHFVKKKYIWHVNCDTWHVKHDTCYVTHESRVSKSHGLTIMRRRTNFWLCAKF